MIVVCLRSFNSRQTHVENFHRAFLVQQQIPRFDVSMAKCRGASSHPKLGAFEATLGLDRSPLLPLHGSLRNRPHD